MNNTRLIESGRRSSDDRLLTHRSGERKLQRRRKLHSSATPNIPDFIILDPTSNDNRTEAALTTLDKSASAPVPIPSQPQIDDFKSLVTEYGRSIIKSALDHEPEEAGTLKDNIIAAKEKIIVRHKTVENELKIIEGEVRKLRSSVFKLREVQAVSDHVKEVDGTTIQDLKKQHKHEWEEKKRFAALLEQETVKRKALEVELAELKRDKKRKRELVAAIWEEAEKIKLN
jgi:hypothetical protein